MTVLVLASRSSIRREMLERAGLISRAVPSNVDEDSIKAICRKEELDTRATAEQLARSKALDVAQAEPQALVIGADQILEFGEAGWANREIELMQPPNCINSAVSRTDW